MKKNNFLRNLSITTLTMCGLSMSAGIIGQATLPSPITEGYNFPAVQSVDGSYLKTVLNDRGKMTVTVVDGDPNKDGEMDIPPNIGIDGFGNFTITEIGKGAFSHRDDIKAVKFPGTVELLNGSFCDCPNLEQVVFPDTVCNQISPNAFENANLTINMAESRSLHDWVKEKESKS